MKLKELFEKYEATSTVWVILYTKDKLILGKRSPHINNPNQWNFFGGNIDPGENTEKAAIRELEEETGYKLSASSLKFITKIGSATYFAAPISNPSELNTTEETSKIRGFKLTDLPNNLHSKTENFFKDLENFFN